MTQIIDERVVVGMRDVPIWVKWKGRVYKIKKIGLHHTYRDGKILYHVFSVTTETLFMKLKFNTENLIWHIEEVSDYTKL